MKLLCGLAAVATLWIAGLNEQCYLAEGTVTKVRCDTVTVRVYTNTFDFYGEDFAEGDRVKLVMNGNFTDDIIQDDEVSYAWVIEE